MTYATDIAANNHRVGYYLAFDGIATRLATHDMGDYGLSGTYLPAMKSPPSGGSLKLDRARSIVMPTGFSVEVMDTSDVRSLLRRRGGTEADLTTALTVSSTDVSFGTNTYANGATIYLDKETITLGTYNAGNQTYEGSTRAVSSSVAATHQVGAIASSVPRYWMGRRAQLYAVNLDTGTEQAIRTAILSSSPVFSNGAWRLEFIDIQRELRRQLMTGFLPERVTGKTLNSTSIVLDVPNAAHFIDGATYPAYVKVAYGDHFEVWSLTSGDVDTGNDQITLRFLNFIESTIALQPGQPPGGLPQLDDDQDITIQQVCWFVQDPAVAALMLLLSTTGFGTNHATYDVLPGRNPSASGDTGRARLGAGIPAAWVDVDSFLEAAGKEPIVVYIDEPVMVLDWLTNEILWRLGGYLYVNGSGKLAFQAYRSAIPQSSITTLDKGDIKLAEVTAVDDESEILAAATWKVNYDPGVGEFLRIIQATWTDTAPIYGDDLPTLELESKTAWVGTNSPSKLVSPAYGNEVQLVAALDRLYSRTRLGVRRTKLTLPWKQHADFVPGKVFKLTDDRMPDGAGSLGISARQHEVVSSSADYRSGLATVDAEEMPQGYIVVPSAIVASSLTIPPGDFDGLWTYEDISGSGAATSKINAGDTLDDINGAVAGVGGLLSDAATGSIGPTGTSGGDCWQGTSADWSLAVGEDISFVVLAKASLGTNFRIGMYAAQASHSGYLASLNFGSDVGFGVRKLDDTEISDSSTTIVPALDTWYALGVSMDHDGNALVAVNGTHLITLDISSVAAEVIGSGANTRAYVGAYRNAANQIVTECTALVDEVALWESRALSQAELEAVTAWLAAGRSLVEVMP